MSQDARSFGILRTTLVLLLLAALGCGGAGNLLRAELPAPVPRGALAPPAPPEPPGLPELLPGKGGPQPAEAGGIPLEAGWNMISFPVARLGSVTPGPGVLPVLYTFGDGSYLPVELTPAALNAGAGTRRGFWAFASQASSISFAATAGAAEPSYVDLGPGFHMVGFPSESATAVGDMTVRPMGGANAALTGSVCTGNAPPPTCLIHRYAFPYAGGVYATRDLSDGSAGFGPGEAAWLYVHESVRLHYRKSALEVVSVSTAGDRGNYSVGSDGSPYEPSPLSADGRYVLFTSTASNLVPGDTNGVGDVFLRDRRTSQTTRVSVGPSGEQSSAICVARGLSADGRHVAFSAHNLTGLIPGGGPGGGIVLRDLLTGQNLRCDVDEAGSPVHAAPAGQPSLSSDGSRLLFVEPRVGVPWDPSDDRLVLRLYARSSGTSRVLLDMAATSCPWDRLNYPTLSGDGRHVVFAAADPTLVPAGANGVPQVYHLDVETGAVARVSVSDGGAAANAEPEGAPQISADGRYVVWFSEASNLVPGDTNGTFDIFRRDLREDRTVRVSVTAGGGQVSTASVDPAVSGDGQTVAFFTLSDELLPDDENCAADVYIRDFAAGTLTRVTSDPLRYRAPGDRPLCSGSDIVHVPTLTLSADGSLACFPAQRPGTWYLFTDVMAVPNTAWVEAPPPSDPAMLRLEGCLLSERRIVQALETYRYDTRSPYPMSLAQLVPDYLPALPSCPSAGRDTYSSNYGTLQNPDAYTFYCAGSHHAEAGVAPDNPERNVVNGSVVRKLP